MSSGASHQRTVGRRLARASARHAPLRAGSGTAAGSASAAHATVAAARVLAVLGGGEGSAVLSHQSGRDCAVARAPPSFASGPWGEHRVSISRQTGKVNGNIVAAK